MILGYWMNNVCVYVEINKGCIMYNYGGLDA